MDAYLIQYIARFCDIKTVMNMRVNRFFRDALNECDRVKKVMTNKQFINTLCGKVDSRLHLSQKELAKSILQHTLDDKLNTCNQPIYDKLINGGRTTGYNMCRSCYQHLYDELVSQCQRTGNGYAEKILDYFESEIDCDGKYLFLHLIHNLRPNQKSIPRSMFTNTYLPWFEANFVVSCGHALHLTLTYEIVIDSFSLRLLNEIFKGATNCGLCLIVHDFKEDKLIPLFIGNEYMSTNPDDAIDRMKQVFYKFPASK